MRTNAEANHIISNKKKKKLRRADEPRVHEQSDNEQSDDEHHDQPVGGDEYQAGNGTDPGDLVQAELSAGNVIDDKQPDDEHHDQPVGEDEYHVGNGANPDAPEAELGAENACVEDDSELEY